MYTDVVRDKNFTAVKVNSQKQVQHVPEYTASLYSQQTVQSDDGTGSNEFKALD